MWYIFTCIFFYQSIFLSFLTSVRGGNAQTLHSDSCFSFFIRSTMIMLCKGSGFMYFINYALACHCFFRFHFAVIIIYVCHTESMHIILFDSILYCVTAKATSVRCLAVPWKRTELLWLYFSNMNSLLCVVWKES